MISKVLNNLAVCPKNVYNIDKTGVLLSKLGSVKALVSRDNLQGYRGSVVKQTLVTAIKCISADSRALHPLII